VKSINENINENQSIISIVSMALISAQWGRNESGAGAMASMANGSWLMANGIFKSINNIINMA